MQISTVLATQTGTPTSKAFGPFNDVDKGNVAIWEVVLSGTGSVSLEGSLDQTNWYLLPLPTGAAGAAVTSSGLATTAIAPFMRAVVTANSANVTVLVAA